MLDAESRIDAANQPQTERNFSRLAKLLANTVVEYGVWAELTWDVFIFNRFCQVAK